jgi:hypothetical protein
MDEDRRAILLPPGRDTARNNHMDKNLICFECDHRQKTPGFCEKCGGSTEEIEFWYGPDFVNVGSSSPTFI